MKKLKYLLGLVILVIVGALAISVCINFCKRSMNNNEVSGYSFDNTSENYKQIESAYNKLKEYSESYIVANVMELPESSICYIEVVTSDGSSTEYPIDEEGNWGTIDVSSEEEPQYMMYDYLTPSNELYTVEGILENGEYSWIHMPKSYAENVKSRNLMFFDRYLDKLFNIESKGTQILNSEVGEEMTVYTAEIPASVVREVCSIDTLGLYGNIKVEYADNENVVDLMNVYEESLKRSMTFSDGLLTIGVSQDGMLAYVGLESGGLGNIMYYTKQIVLGDTIESRPIPDFSSSREYMSDVEGLAGYVASFGSYEEAMENLYGGVSSQDVTSSEEIVEEITE